jgi:hypothetical protein
LALTIFNNNMLLTSQAKPASPDAAFLAKIVISLMRADKELEEAKTRVPNYTGPNDPSDYYAQEQQDWNNAANSLLSILSEVADDRIQARIGRRG